MSILAKKNITIISDNASFATKLKEILEAESASPSILTYHTYDISGLTNHTDLVIIDHCSPTGVCGKVMTTLKSNSSSAALPVLAIIQEHDPVVVEQVLLAGASDFATHGEPSEVITIKLKSLLSSPADTFSSGDIDITEYENSPLKQDLRVYVIEDDPLLGNLLRHKFNQHNIIAAFSNDGVGVIQKMSSFKPSVVVLDLMLPGVSGFDILKDMQANPDLSEVPVVVFSNRDSSEDRAKAHALGAKKFYVKAVTSLSELVDILQEVVAT